MALTQQHATALQQLAQAHPRHAEITRLNRDFKRNYAAAQRAEREQAEQLAVVEQNQRQAELAAAQAAQQQALRIDPWQLSEQAQSLEVAGDAQAARQLFADLVATDPTTDAWFAYALLLERQDDYAGARELLAQVPLETWSEGMQALDQRARDWLAADAAAQLAQQQQPLAQPELVSEQTREAELWIGWDHGSRNSTDGISSLTTDTLLLRLTVPMQDDPDGEWFVQIDPIKASAGAADLDDSFWRERFGTGLICQQNCPTGIQPEANEQGVAVGIGARSSDWYADIGLSPIGFERNTVVGGLGVTGDLGQFGVGAEIERRVLTSSLLNFASINDPFSDRSWGLVTRNNLGFSASWDQGSGWGWWANAGMNWYRGHNVANNQQWYAYSGLYSTVYDTEPLSIDVGLTALSWGFDNDQSQSTYGQGGYYSPRRYVSLSIPLTFYGRFERWSYRFRASLGKSDTQLAAAAFYPNNPELQQQAQLVAPQTGVEPVFAGGNGGGFGRSFNANVEYRIDTHWYVGFSAALQRSEFYDPDSFMLYFRYQFGGSSAPPRKPPLPPSRYVDEAWF
ncbi:MAG: Cellulose synthase operon protein C [Pseudidiomarina mangrovi]|nr:MAG: Cellulose synthase operon protein C [Pseudidiomarina mangrovi]